MELALENIVKKLDRLNGTEDLRFPFRPETDDKGFYLKAEDGKRYTEQTKKYRKAVELTKEFAEIFEEIEEAKRYGTVTFEDLIKAKAFDSFERTKLLDKSELEELALWLGKNMAWHEAVKQNFVPECYDPEVHPSEKKMLLTDPLSVVIEQLRDTQLSVPL